MVTWDRKRKAYIVHVVDDDKSIRHVTVKPRSMTALDVADARALGETLIGLLVEEARRRAQEARETLIGLPRGDDRDPLRAAVGGDDDFGTLFADDGGDDHDDGGMDSDSGGEGGDDDSAVVGEGNGNEAAVESDSPDDEYTILE